MTEILRKRPTELRTARLDHFDRSWSVRTLANGMKALHVPTIHDDQLIVGVMIRAGTRLEMPAIAGVSHFLEHMMFRGSRRYPQFTQLAEAFEWLGGEWNAATAHEHTEYWYSGIRSTAPEVIDLFAEFLDHPQFADIEIERSIISRELDGELNDHGHSLDLDHHVATLIWPNTPLSLPILGTHETLANITVDTLRTFRDRYYTPGNMLVYVAGGDPAPSRAIDDLVDQHFAGLRKDVSDNGITHFTPPPQFRGPACKWVQHNDNEYEIKLSFLCEGEWSDDAPCYELLTRILADGFCSRLLRRLREELGLVYDINAHTSLGIDCGTIDINASCAQEGLDTFLKELFALLHDFASEGPTEDELNRTLVRSIVELELSASRPEAIGPRLAWALLNGRTLSLGQERERLLSVTQTRLAKLCRELFRPERAAMVALGPPGRDLERRLKKALSDGLKGIGVPGPT